MLEVMKKLATLFMAIGLISMSCAATIPPQTMLLGGTPRVETIGSTIGMTTQELDQELRTPHGSDTCAFPFDIDGQEAMAQGKAFMWSHEFTNIPEQEMRTSSIIVCVMDGVVVAEHREWVRRSGSVISTGQTNAMDPELVQAIMDNLLKAKPSGGTPKFQYRNRGFEI